MEIIRDAWNQPSLPRRTVATIGNYDGIHRGQQKILSLVAARARETGLTSVLVTFDPHPLAVLHPEEAPRRLVTERQKERLLDEMGIDVVVVVHFTPELARTPARRFVRRFMHQRLEAQEIYVGSRFVFGAEREGDLSLLQAMGESFHFRAFGVREVQWQGEPVSSTRIRRAVAAGRVDDAAAMLGREFSVSGLVARGDRRGKELGWPTINLAPENEMLPADGVYATSVTLERSAEAFRSVTNVGTRPTVYKEERRLVESHILDFERDIYGDRVEVSFYERLREERSFGSLTELSTQIGRDVERTREYFEASDCWDGEGSANGPAARESSEKPV